MDPGRGAPTSCSRSYATNSYVRSFPVCGLRFRSRYHHVATVVENILLALMVDIETKTDNVEPIVYLLNSHEHLGRMVSASCRSFRARPVARCQHCELCAEELRVPSESFKKCSTCSDELDCDVYYCSQYVHHLQTAPRAHVQP